MRINRITSVEVVLTIAIVIILIVGVISMASSCEAQTIVYDFNTCNTLGCSLDVTVNSSVNTNVHSMRGEFRVNNVVWAQSNILPIPGNTKVTDFFLRWTEAARLFQGNKDPGTLDYPPFNVVFTLYSQDIFNLGVLDVKLGGGNQELVIPPFMNEDYFNSIVDPLPGNFKKLARGYIASYGVDGIRSVWNIVRDISPPDSNPCRIPNEEEYVNWVRNLNVPPSLVFLRNTFVNTVPSNIWVPVFQRIRSDRNEC